MLEPQKKLTASTHRLTGSLSAWHIVCMVMAAAAPLTVVGGNIPLAIGLGNGFGAPFGFLIAALVLLVFAIGFVSMTPYVKEAGAFYSYVSLGLGQKMGMGAAYVALMTYTAIQAGIYGYTGWAINDLIVNFGGPAYPWWIYSFFTILLVAFLGYRNIDLSSKVLAVSLIFEIGIVLILNFSILAQGGAEGINLQSFTPQNALSSGLSMAVLFALTGFIGFESAAIYRDESIDPARTIPKATYWSVIVIGVFYTFSAWCLVIAAGRSDLMTIVAHTLNGNGNMLLDIAQSYAGITFRNMIQLLLISSLFACVLSFHNILVRYQYALAKKGDLNINLVVTHPKYQSPSRSSLVQTVTAFLVVIICALFQLDPLTQVFGYMAGVATIGCMMLMLLTSIAVACYFYKNHHLSFGQKIKTKIMPLLSIILLGCALSMILLNLKTLTGGSLLICVILAILPLLALLFGIVRQGQLIKD